MRWPRLKLTTRCATTGSTLALRPCSRKASGGRIRMEARRYILVSQYSSSNRRGTRNSRLRCSQEPASRALRGEGGAAQDAGGKREDHRGPPNGRTDLRSTRAPTGAAAQERRTTRGSNGRERKTIGGGRTWIWIETCSGECCGGGLSAAAAGSGEGGIQQRHQRPVT